MRRLVWQKLTPIYYVCMLNEQKEEIGEQASKLVGARQLSCKVVVSRACRAPGQFKRMLGAPMSQPNGEEHIREENDDNDADEVELEKSTWSGDATSLRAGLYNVTPANLSPGEQNYCSSRVFPTSTCLTHSSSGLVSSAIYPKHVHLHT